MQKPTRMLCIGVHPPPLPCACSPSTLFRIFPWQKRWQPLPPLHQTRGEDTKSQWALKELSKGISHPSFFKLILQLSPKGKIETNTALTHAIAAYVAISMPPLAPLPMGVLLGFALGKLLWCRPRQRLCQVALLVLVVMEAEDQEVKGNISINMGTHELVKEGKLPRKICLGDPLLHHGDYENNDHPNPMLFTCNIAILLSHWIFFDTCDKGQSKMSDIKDGSYAAMTITIAIGEEDTIFLVLLWELPVFEIWWQMCKQSARLQSHRYNLINAASCGIKTTPYELIFVKLCSKQKVSTIIQDEVSMDDRCDGDHSFNRLMLKHQCIPLLPNGSHFKLLQCKNSYFNEWLESRILTMWVWWWRPVQQMLNVPQEECKLCWVFKHPFKVLASKRRPWVCFCAHSL